MSDNHDALTHRLDRVERENRRWKFGTCLALAVGVLGVALGAKPEKAPQIVEASGFVMRDAKGVKRVEIGAEGFYVNNEDGKRRISIFSGKEGGTGIALFADDTYKKQVLLGIQDKLDGYCGLNVNDDKGAARVLVGLQGGKTQLELHDETGKPVFAQPQR